MYLESEINFNIFDSIVLLTTTIFYAEKTTFDVSDSSIALEKY